jgi:hypothetical protein
MQITPNEHHPNQHLVPLAHPFQQHLFPLLGNQAIMRVAQTCAYLYSQVTHANREWERRMTLDQIRKPQNDQLSSFERYARTKQEEIANTWKGRFSSLLAGVKLLTPKVFYAETWRKAWNFEPGG